MTISSAIRFCLKTMNAGQKPEQRYVVWDVATGFNISWEHTLKPYTKARCQCEDRIDHMALNRDPENHRTPLRDRQNSKTATDCFPHGNNYYRTWGLGQHISDYALQRNFPDWGPYGLQYEDGSWLRNDGCATEPGKVNRAWSGTYEEAERMLELQVPLASRLGQVKVAKLPIA
jgi:hypothetical protein